MRSHGYLLPTRCRLESGSCSGALMCSFKRMREASLRKGRLNRHWKHACNPDGYRSDTGILTGGLHISPCQLLLVSRVIGSYPTGCKDTPISCGSSSTC